MDIWNADNYSSLTPAQRRAVEARAPEGKTPVEYLNDLGAGLAAIDSYVGEDDVADARAFQPFFDAARRLSQPGRVALALDIRDRCAGEGQDVSELDRIIEGFAAAEAARALRESPKV